ncbi:putative ribonuclease H-like domain-containing protein [Tanacetum coccineum]
MTYNKDQLENFKEFNGGSVTFGGSKGYITGKGKIRVGNLDFNSVSFVKELGHFNLFSISQICDKQHKVLFTKTECLVVSSDFKMLDENQILLNVPRQHNMYSFDMKTPTSAKSFACLIAKATSDESKMWHRRNKGIKQDYRNSKTPQQNGVVERQSRTLIEAARTMLTDSLLPTTFWAEAVSTACYVLNMNQANPHAGTLEVTNSTGTLQTLNFDAFEEKDVDAELIVVPSAVRNTEEKVETRKSSTNSKKEEILTEPQHEKEASSTDTLEDNPKIIAFRRDERVNTDKLDPNDSPMLELKNFHKSKTGIFDDASYDEEGVITDFNSLPTEIKVVKALYGLHQAPRAWYATLSTFLEKHGYKRGTIDKTLFIKRTKKDYHAGFKCIVDDFIFRSTKIKKSWCDEFEALMKSIFQMSSMGELTFFLGLQVKQNKAGIFISQDKYVAEILKKFDLVNVKTTITPMETKVDLTKDEEAIDVDVHLYRSMIGSLMYLTSSRPDIMYAACVCSRFQATPKTSHLNAVKRIFKYLKGKSNLGLWYPKESPFDLETFSDSDYSGSNLDRKSTTGGCQFLGQRLISWQCKKQTIVATSTTEAEYVATENCCGQVLWVQNQLLDYGFNFMNTKIHIDNESTICIVKNPVYHSKTKHIEIRHHFIRDCYEKKLISVEKIHTDLNVADLLTKPFDGPRFNYLVVSIGIAWIYRRKAGVLRYALTNNPTIHDSLVKQFWQTATATTLADGTLELKATIDTIEYTITEASIRSKLQLADASGITKLQNNRDFEGWGIWEVGNLKSKTKFLMYPRFLQLILDIQTENNHPYLAVTLTKNIFGNMKRGFRGVPRPFLPAMLSIVDPSAGQEAPSVTQPQPSSSMVPPTPPTTQPIPSEATTIPPLSQLVPPTPIVKTTLASPSPSPSPTHEPMEHTFEQPSSDQQPPTPR